MRQQYINPEKQVTQGGCIRLLGYLLLALGVIVGLLVIASFGKTLGGGNNSQQQPTTLDDVQQYVFDTMAKPVQDYRLKHPTALLGRNLGMGRIVLEYADGSPIYSIPSEFIPGQDGKGPDKNSEHSERKLHDPGGFIPVTLQHLQASGELDKASKVYIFIFTQVLVCDLCRPEMRGWLNDFRAEVSPANQSKLEFQVWEPTFTFNPRASPTQQRQMVSSEDITQEPIKFFPPPKPGKP